MSVWLPDECDGWKRELPGTVLRVDAPDDAVLTNDDELDKPPHPKDTPEWVWRVFRAVDRFTEVELDSGRAETRELAMVAADAAASTYR